jgi:hypothetical protein
LGNVQHQSETSYCPKGDEYSSPAASAAAYKGDTVVRTYNRVIEKQVTEKPRTKWSRGFFCAESRQIVTVRPAAQAVY